MSALSTFEDKMKELFTEEELAESARQLEEKLQGMRTKSQLSLEARLSGAIDVYGGLLKSRTEATELIKRLSERVDAEMEKNSQSRNKEQVKDDREMIAELKKSAESDDAKINVSLAELKNIRAAIDKQACQSVDMDGLEEVHIANAYDFLLALHRLLYFLDKRGGRGRTSEVCRKYWERCKLQCMMSSTKSQLEADRENVVTDSTSARALYLDWYATPRDNVLNEAFK